MTRFELLKALCKTKNISINKLEQELGFSQGSLSKIDTNVPKADKLYLIAKYFDIPMETFFDEQNETVEEYFTKVQNNLKQVPVYDVAAGQGYINDTYTSETIVVDANEDTQSYSYCTIHGDSMYPVLMDGDIVKVFHTTETDPSDLTVIRIDGEECTVKHIEVTKEGLWVRAINKSVFDDRFYTVQEVVTLPISVIGKVVKLRRNF